MINHTDIKKGTYIHWVANRMFKSWNVFGKIIDVAGDDVTIQTYDYMNTTVISKTGESMINEISVSSKEAALKYMQANLITLENSKITEINNHQEKLAMIDNRIKVIGSCIQAHTVND